MRAGPRVPFQLCHSRDRDTGLPRQSHLARVSIGYRIACLICAGGAVRSGIIIRAAWYGFGGVITASCRCNRRKSSAAGKIRRHTSNDLESHKPIGGVLYLLSAKVMRLGVLPLAVKDYGDLRTSVPSLMCTAPTPRKAGLHFPKILMQPMHCWGYRQQYHS